MDSDFISTIISFLFIFAMVVSGFLLAFYRLKKDREKLRMLAKELNLEMIEGTGNQIPKSNGFLSDILQAFTPWSIRGESGGIQFEIFQETKGSGKNQTIYTVIKHELKSPLNFEMELTRQFFLEGFFVGLFDLQDIIIGNKEFDDAFRIKGSDVKSVQSLLVNPQLQSALMNLHKMKGEILVTHKLIQIHVQGALREPARFHHYFQTIGGVVQNLSGGNSGVYDPFK